MFFYDFISSEFLWSDINLRHFFFSAYDGARSISKPPSYFPSTHNFDQCARHRLLTFKTNRILEHILSVSHPAHLRVLLLYPDTYVLIILPLPTSTTSQRACPTSTRCSPLLATTPRYYRRRCPISGNALYTAFSPVTGVLGLNVSGREPQRLLPAWRSTFTPPLRIIPEQAQTDAFGNFDNVRRCISC